MELQKGKCSVFGQNYARHFGNAAVVYETSFIKLLFLCSDLFATMYDASSSRRIFGEEEIKSRASVVMLGSKVKDELLVLLIPRWVKS